MRKTVLLIFLMVGIVFSSGYSSLIGGYLKYREYKNQMEELAKNYAEKKYDRKYKVERSYDSGLSVVLGEYKDTSWFTSKKINECTVFLINVNNHINANPSVASIADKYNVNSDNCGESILAPKIKKYIESNFVSKYYNLNKLDFRIGIIYNTPKKYYDLERLSYRNKGTYKIFNQDDNWDLSTKEWLAKYKDKIQVNNVSINIYQQPETAESIAKAMEFGYRFDKYLRNLTTSHKIRQISVYLTNLNKKEMQKKGGLVKIVRYSKEYPGGAIFNYYSVFNDGGEHKYKKMTNSNIFDFVEMTNSNLENGFIPIKETKYYQPVKKILDSKLKNK